MSDVATASKKKLAALIALLETKDYDSITVIDDVIFLVRGDEKFPLILSDTPESEEEFTDLDGLLHNYFVGQPHELLTISSLLRAAKPHWCSQPDLGHIQEIEAAKVQLNLIFHGWVWRESKPHAVVTFDDINGVRRKNVLAEVKYYHHTPYVTVHLGWHSHWGPKSLTFWLI